MTSLLQSSLDSLTPSVDGTIALAFGPIGVWELLVIGAIFVLLFGAAKLPQLGRGLGEGIANFRRGLKSSGELDEAQPDDLAESAHKS